LQLATCDCALLPVVLRGACGMFSFGVQVFHGVFRVCCVVYKFCSADAVMSSRVASRSVCVV